MSRLPIPERVLEQHVIALGKTGAGKSSKMRVLIEHLLRKRERVTIIDIKGDWWGLKASADGKSEGFPIVIFGGKHADVPLAPGSGRAVAELLNSADFSCLIDLRGWRPGDRARWYIDFMDATFEKTEGKRYIMIAEVHNFAPKGKVLSPQAGEMLHWSNRLASEGRGMGLTLLADSQRPQKVHNDLLTSCETLIACRVIHKSDREAVEDWIDGCADPTLGKQVIRELAGMKKPDSWVWSPEIDFGPQRVEWPLFSTFDSFKPQEAASTGRLKGWAEVDVDALKTKLATVVKEAEANDPAALKRRIAELERQLKAGGTRTADDVAAARTDGERVGFDKGVRQGYRAGWDAHIYAVSDALRAIPLDPPDVGARPENPERRVEGRRPAEAVVERRTGTAPSLPRSHRQIDGRAPANGSGEQLPKVERLILTALAQYPQGRTKAQIAILTGYASTGGGFNNALSALRSKGYVADRSPLLLITNEGLEALGDYEPLPSGDALLQHWLGQLSKAERAALAALAGAYPSALTKEQVAEVAGYEANGGGFNNALSRLRTLELVSGRGELRASEDLFT